MNVAALKFKWTAAVSAPAAYPVEVLTGYFGGAGDSAAFITAINSNGATTGGEWGSSSSTILAGDDYKSLPATFGVTWVSFAEKKAYACTGNLAEQPMKSLFQEGFQVRADGKRRTYDEITVGLAPGGWVCLWLSGAGVVKELGCFEGHEVAIDLTQYRRNPDGLSSAMLFEQGFEDQIPEDRRRQLRAGTEKIAFENWKTEYRKKYAWRPVVRFPAGAAPKDVFLKYYNGEAEILPGTAFTEATGSPRPVPWYVQIKWAQNDFVYTCRLQAKEAPEKDTALFAAFERLATTGDSPGDFIVAVNGTTPPEIFLSKAGKTFPVKAYTAVVHRSSKK